MTLVSDKIRISTKTKKLLSTQKSILEDKIGMKISFDDYINIVLSKDYKLLIVPSRKRKRIKKDELLTLAGIF